MDLKFYAGIQTNKDTIATENLHLLVATKCDVAPKYSTTNSKAIGIGGAFESDGWVSKAEVDGTIETELTISQLKLFLECGGYKAKAKGQNLEFELDPDGFSKYLSIFKDFYRESTYDVAKGCLISSIKLNTTLQAYVTGSFSLVGMDYENKDQKLTPKLERIAVADGRLKCLGTTIKESGTDITSKIESIDITIDRKLEGKGALNTIYNKAIKPSSKGEVSLSLQFNEFDKESYQKAVNMLKNNTSYEIEISLADDLDPTRIIKIVFPKVKVSSTEVTDLEGTGGIQKELKAYTPDGKDLPFTLEISNYTKA